MPSVGVAGVAGHGGAAGTVWAAVVVAELRRRLPGASVRLVAPSGDDRPALDLLVVAALSGQKAPGHGSGQLARLAFPDPLLLLPRLIGGQLLDRRLLLLRMLGWLPAEAEPYLAVDADLAPPLREAALAAAAEAGFAVTVIEPGASGTEWPPAVPAVRRLPAQAGVEDLACAVRSARGVIAVGSFSAACAQAFGVPALDLQEGQMVADVGAWVSRLSAGVSEAPDAAAAIAAVDAELDAIAALLPDASPQPKPAPPAVPPLLRAYRLHAAGRRRLQRAFLDELGVLKTRIREVERERDDEVARAEREILRLEGVVAGLLNSRTIRYTQPARALYRRLRGRR
jgi:hypothetical protein